jgi:hypothetical protein
MRGNMKVTIGDLTVEISPGEEDMAFNLINRLVSDKQPDLPTKRRAARKKVKKAISKASDLNEKEQLVLKAMNESIGVDSRTSIAASTGLDPQTVSVVLSNLKKKAYVHNPEMGVWRKVHVA